MAIASCAQATEARVSDMDPRASATTMQQLTPATAGYPHMYWLMRPPVIRHTILYDQPQIRATELTEHLIA
jgi:hypothetical protein